MTTKRTKLNDKIKFVKKVFQMPYHFFYAGVKSSLVGIRFEDKQGRHFEFTAASMFSAVQDAEKYVTTELAAGNLQDLSAKKDNTKNEDK